MVFNKINFNPIKPIVWLCNLPWPHNYQLSEQLIYYMTSVSNYSLDFFLSKIYFSIIVQMSILISASRVFLL